MSNLKRKSSENDRQLSIYITFCDARPRVVEISALEVTLPIGPTLWIFLLSVLPDMVCSRVEVKKAFQELLPSLIYSSCSLMP